MNTHVMAEGPQYGSGNDSMAALSQVSGGNHTYAGSSQDQLNDREASFPYGYNYTPTGTPTHSYSTADRTSEHPSLMRDSTARASVRKGGKLVPLKVQMLDDSVIALHVPNGCLGADLFKECCRHLNLLEMDYFGLEYFNKTDKVVWLDLEKPIARQVAAPKKTLFHFTVKFYLADPSQLQDEFTKYLYALQIKKDLANGRLPCSENTAALMASYMLQAEVGDYTSPDHDDGRYISAFRFVPNQTRAMESKIQEYHKNHVGQTPADADFNLLDVARRLEMYGVQLHAARDYENVQLHLAVSHQGVLVFHNNSRINTFSWAKIRKLSFKRKRFLVKLHPEGFGYPRSTVEFMMTSRNDCKRFWKCCVEHHTFFRLTQPKHGRRPRRRLLSRGSTFRYSGRTQKQVVEDARVTYIQRPGFGPSLARVSTRSLGAPRTTTPLTINLTESIVPDHHSAPDLTYGQSYANGQGDNAVSSPTSVSPTTPSSTPVTPVHDNSRIAIHKGQSNSSITYEYTVNEDNPQMQSSSEVNGDSEPVHILPTESAPTEAAPQEEPKVQPEPQPEKEVQSPVINGEHNGHEGLSTNYSTDTSDISIPSGSLHIDVDYEMRRQVILDLPDEIERLEDPFVEEEGPKRERHESGSSSSSSGSHSIEDGEGLEYEDEIQTEEGFDLEILEGIGGPTLSEFDENGRAKRMGFPDTGKKFDMREARAKFEVLESLQMPVTSDPEDESPTKSVEAEVGSVGSGTSGELLGSMQAAASNGSTSSDELNFVRTERASTEIRLSNTIDEVLKIAAELASPTDEPYTPSFESRSLDSFLNEEGSDVGQKGFDITPEDDSANPKNYSSFMKERQLVFDDSSDESDDSSLGAKLGETNKNLTNLEENLDETSADLRLLEESLAETRKSLKAMEHDVLSDTSTESPVFPAFDTDQQNEIELTPESPCRDTPVFSTPSDSLTEDIINANTPEPIAEAKITPQNDSQTKQAPLDEADLARALTPAALESHNLKRLHDMPPPPTPPPTPKVSVVDSPTHIPKISTVELHKITSFDDMMPPPPPRAHSNPSTGKVKNIAHMLPDLPPPPPLPLSPPPDSPPPCPSPLSPPHATIMKYTFNYDIQRPPPPVPVVKAAPPARPPKPKPIKVDSRKFEDAEKSPVPPTPPPRMESKQPKIKPQFDFRHSSGVTRVQSSSYHAHVSVQQTTSSVVTKKEAGVQMSGFSEVQRSEFSESRTVKAVTTTKHETAETQRSTLECMLENQEVSSIERPPPPIVSLNPQQKSDEVSETVDTIVITPESNEMRLTRPGTFVTELKMIVRPGKIHVSDSRSKRECSNNQDKSFKSSEISKGSPESSSNWNNSSNLVSSDNRKSSSKRESMESTDSDDSARQEFSGRSLDDLLNSPDIVGYPTPDDDDSTRGLAEESYLLQGDLRYSETSSTTSGSSDDSCVYHYQVAEAQMTKVKGEAPLAKADDSGSSSDDDSNSSTSTEENGLLNRHAMGNGGIVLTNAVTEAPGLFSDLQDVASPLSALSGETAASSEDFD
ncbi:COPII coat assembly protein sec16-like isoform X2 [Acanthaster planci]|uniref:COPII coat assembly protein sec16-like isoform X2 n=1 Tax=Acanthaster planci TaxID=133434 RepID=A0A8B7YQV5_ACAPL|nr:COPII coat assembly protein sec16-like isoform X2 [Acanthaster planci]